MTYIELFEAELVRKLQSDEDATSIVRWVLEKVLESYRNGITAGQKGTQAIGRGRAPSGGDARSSFGWFSRKAWKSTGTGLPQAQRASRSSARGRAAGAASPPRP